MTRYRKEKILNKPFKTKDLELDVSITTPTTTKKKKQPLMEVSFPVWEAFPSATTIRAFYFFEFLKL